MSTCYEFALECEIRGDVTQEVIETLKYMTRAKEYKFTTPKINYPLFEEPFPWAHGKTILTNQPREGEQYLPGEFGSFFVDRRSPKAPPLRSLPMPTPPRLPAAPHDHNELQTHILRKP
jgi:hypothetical protein